MDMEGLKQNDDLQDPMIRRIELMPNSELRETYDRVVRHSIGGSGTESSPEETRNEFGILLTIEMQNRKLI